MLTKQVTKTTEVTFWTCNVPGHAHKTRDVAERCLVRRPADGDRANIRWTNEKIADLCTDIINGMTCEAASKKYNVSNGRVGQIFWDAIYKAHHLLDEIPRRLRPVPSIDVIRDTAYFWLPLVARLREPPSPAHDADRM